MISLEVILYAFVNGAILMLSVLGLESALVSPSLDRWSKRFFTAFFADLVVSSLTFFLELTVYVHPSLITLELITYFLQSLLYIIPYPMLTLCLLHCCGEEWRGSRLLHAMMVLWAVCLVLLCAALVTPYFYRITPDNQLELTPAYPLLVVPVLAMLVLSLAGVVKRRNKLTRQYYLAFLICLLPVTLAICVHLFTPVFVLINVGLAFSIFSMYRVIESDSVEQALRQQREIASQRAKIAVLQMRPHFIHNTMTSIYYLCDQDPKKAQRVTMDFNTYLRKNLTAIAKDETIPFAEELEHARAYLSVEQAQFGSKLVVDYDVPHTHFRVPPLTLQPLVENAVKHGMGPKTVPLRVTIQTRKVDSASEIVVEDNGPGFDFAIADDPHTTLANIRQRLEMMCGGSLEFEPREGRGTVARVSIPE